MHVVDQLQPYSELQVVELEFELHGVTVPVQVPVQEHPYCSPQVVAVVMPEQAVGVPLQGVVHVQPAFPQRADDV